MHHGPPVPWVLTNPDWACYQARSSTCRIPLPGEDSGLQDLPVKSVPWLTLAGDWGHRKWWRPPSPSGDTLLLWVRRYTCLWQKLKTYFYPFTSTRCFLHVVCQSMLWGCLNCSLLRSGDRLESWDFNFTSCPLISTVANYLYEHTVHEGGKRLNWEVEAHHFR